MALSPARAAHYRPSRSAPSWPKRTIPQRLPRRWRAELVEQQALTTSASPAFAPLALPPPAAGAAEKPAGLDIIEIELASGHRLWAEAAADLTLLQGVIAALLGR